MNESSKLGSTAKEKRIGTSPKQVTKVLEVQTCLFKDELDHWTQLKNTN